MVSVLTSVMGTGNQSRNFPNVSLSQVSPLTVRPLVAFLLTMKASSGSKVLTNDNEFTPLILLSLPFKCSVWLRLLVLGVVLNGYDFGASGPKPGALPHLLEVDVLKQRLAQPLLG